MAHDIAERIDLRHGVLIDTDGAVDRVTLRLRSPPNLHVAWKGLDRGARR